MSEEDLKLPYRAVFSDEIKRILPNLAKRNRLLHRRLSDEIRKVLNNPEVGKPLRYDLKSYRRTHVGAYVLVYEVIGESVFFTDFDHHDKIYKKFS